MSHRLICFLVFCISSPVTPAGEKPTGQPAPTQPGTPAEEFKALVRELEETATALRDALKGGKDALAKFEETYGKKSTTLGARFLALAQKYSQDPVAIDSLSVLTGTLRVPESAQARELLQRNHLRSDRLGTLCPRLRSYWSKDADGNEKLLRAILEKNPHTEVQAQACFNLAELLVEKAEVAEALKGRGAAADRALNALGLGAEQAKQLLAGADEASFRKEAEQLFERVIEKHADVKHPGPSTTRRAGVEYRSHRGGRPLGGLAKVGLLNLRELVVGKPAPEIEGEDADGNKFKLSDYRGKVVVVSFWGHWCAPCMAQVPHERKLVKRLEGQPFAFLGVNTDETRDRLKQATAKGDIPWRNWWDGGSQEGPIVTRYGVESFPAVFVLDHRGVIRHKGVHGEALDRAVDALLQKRNDDPE